MSDIFSELHAFGYFCWHYIFSSFTIKSTAWLNGKYQNVGLSLFVEKFYFSLTECLLAPPRWPRFSAYLCWSSWYFAGSSGRWGWCNSTPVNLLCHSPIVRTWWELHKCYLTCHFAPLSHESPVAQGERLDSAIWQNELVENPLYTH